MNKIYLLALAVTIASCSSLKTSYDFDSQTDFSKYKTFAFTENSMKLPIQELNRTRMLQAIENELTAKGLTKSDNPDVLIDLHVKAEQKQDATATTTGPGMYGGYGAPWRYGYGAGFSTTQINVNEYTEGTLFINMVDKATDKLVWQGRGTKVIDEDASAEKRTQNINTAISSIFQKYPPKAK
jgi:hypothetical protein